MNFLPSQIILAIAFLLLAIYVFRVRTITIDRIIYLLLASGGMVLTLRPDISTKIANTFGVGRGADLVFYLFIVFGLFHFVTISSKFQQLEQQITNLVRELAIAQAQIHERSSANSSETDDKPGA